MSTPSNIKTLSDLPNMASLHIAEEFGRWADIFLDGSSDPERLHVEHRGDMTAMSVFIGGLVSRENRSGRNYPENELAFVFGEIGEIKDALAEYYDKGSYAPSGIRSRILKLNGRLLNLQIQYSKLS